jgi:hypothetical protein
MSRRRTPAIGWLAITAALVGALVCGAEPESVDGPTDIIELACDKPLEISNVRVKREEVLRYNKFEITFDLVGRWDNPFDPTQVKVDGEFTSPNGEVMVVPGFYYQEYRRTMVSGEDTYEPIGEPVWKVRFAPSEPGEYSYQIKVGNGEKTAATDASTFICSPHTANHGFVRISKTNPLYFEYDDGTPFFALATCKWWDKLADIETHYTEFARAGGNMTRNFLMRIGELVADKDQYKVPSPPRPDRGFGRIDLDRAWRHDKALEQCEQLGICQQLAIANGTCFMSWDKNRWKMSVYNARHGGPLTERSGQARHFLTDPAARENFKRELRYFVARWGYSTAVFSWNLWNEIDLIPKYDSLRDEAKQWHREMGQYLEQIDWAGHVVHTNFKTINGDPRLHDVPEMEMVSVNSYRQMDFAASAEMWIKRHLGVHHKPVMFSEFGIGDARNPEGYDPHDPDRVMAHNGMWSAVMSGSAGTGMAFGWNWLKNDKYYTYLNALAKYVDGVRFAKRTWQPIDIESFRFNDPARPPYHADVYVEGHSTSYWFPDGWKDREVFEVDSKGRLKDRDLLHMYLGATVGRSRVVLKADYREPGTFAVLVREVRSRANDPGPPELTVSLGDQVLLQQELAVDPEDALDFYDRYECAVPAGEHEIVIENTGGGFFPVGYELGNFVRREGPDLQVRGMQTDDIILVWLKAPKLTWLYARLGIEPQKQAAGRLVLANVPDGTWVAEWLDTIQNKWLQRSVEISRDDKLTIETPPIRQSVAVRLFKAENAP